MCAEVNIVPLAVMLCACIVDQWLHASFDLQLLCGPIRLARQGC